MKKIIFTSFCVLALLPATMLATTTPQISTSINAVEKPAIQIKFDRVLKRGLMGDDVRMLQQALAAYPDIYPEGLVTGYFGKLTERAVKQLQEAVGIVSSGSPETTGYGQVGPKTTAKINEIAVSGGGNAIVSFASPITPTPVPSTSVPSTTPSATPAVVTQSSTAVSTSTNITSSGSYSYSGSSGDSSAPSTPTYYSEPAPPPSTGSSSTSTSSTTPASPPPPTPPPAPSSDTTGPTITSLLITPTSATVGSAISFSATAEDPSGIRTIVYQIQYPGVSIVLSPNCNFNGVTVGTCAFGEPIDHARQNPSVLGDYTIIIRAVDMLDNVAYYYPNGTVTNGVSATHNLTIPAITISAAP